MLFLKKKVKIPVCTKYRPWIGVGETEDWEKRWGEGKMADVANPFENLRDGGGGGTKSRSFQR